MPTEQDLDAMAAALGYQQWATLGWQTRHEVMKLALMAEHNDLLAEISRDLDAIRGKVG